MGKFSVRIKGFVQACLYSHQTCNGLRDVDNIFDKKRLHSKNDESEVICGE